MTTLIIISILLAVLFVGIASWRQKELPASISAMVYTFGKKGQWTWTIWMWAIAGTLTPPMIEAAPENFKFIAFITCALLLFTGTMPLIRGEKNTMHYIVAALAGVFSQIFVATTCQWWLLPWTGVLGFFIWLTLKEEDPPKYLVGKGTFIIETVCWLTTIGTVIIH